jgi:hypothetical protein
MSAAFSAPTARLNLSPGQRLGTKGTHINQALKGRFNPCRNLPSIGRCLSGPPIQGFGLVWGIIPRALPWADMVRPFGAGECLTLATLRDTLLPKLLSGELRAVDGMDGMVDGRGGSGGGRSGQREGAGRSLKP